MHLPFAQLANLAATTTDVLNNFGNLNSITRANATFDYIVVGGGTAGVTVAARLAEHNFSVALVEAGKTYEIQSPMATIPGANSIGVGSDIHSTTPVDWKFLAKDVPGANHRNIHYPRGKCLGGSSAINFMMYQRPTVESMQIWADLVHDESYTFENVLPFFKRTVEFTPPNQKIRGANATPKYNADAFSKDGYPLHVSYANYAMPFSSWLKRGFEYIGIKETQDFNSGSLFGHQYCTTTIRPSDATRSSSESAFLRSSSSPANNLKLYSGTMAKVILFNSQKQATGVRVKTGMHTYTLTAKQGIIVSAGVFHTPQLLMVSGIGPANILREHGIDVISNLPGVGQNMWDHVFFGPTYQVAVETFVKVVADPVYLIERLSEYLITHKGALSSQITDYIAFEKIPPALRPGLSTQTKKDLSWFPDDWPEIEYMSASAYVGNFSYPLDSQPRDGKQYATVLGVLVAPTSRGNVTISSTDTADLPVINPNWLATETDQQVAIAAYKRIRDIFHSEPMAPIIVGDEYFPGRQHQTDAEILEVIRNTVMTIYHAACTCKMGIQDDPMAVLDSHAKVFGVDRLRVVDSSAFPILVPGHPQSTIYMLAEKIASEITSSR